MLRSTGLTWKDRPICGNAVAMIVPSRFSMKNAPATRMAMDVDLVEDRGRPLIISESVPISKENVAPLRNPRRNKPRRLNLTFISFYRDGVRAAESTLSTRAARPKEYGRPIFPGSDGI